MKLHTFELFLILLGGIFAMANCHADGMNNILIPAHSVWKYDSGAPSVTSTAWTNVEFDDSKWPSGHTGLGYGDDDDRTKLDDMRGIT